MNGAGDRILVQCPHCGACFRVAEKTLAKAQGWALCGECFEPFPALAHRLPEPEPTIPAATAQKEIGGSGNESKRQAEPSISAATAALAAPPANGVADNVRAPSSLSTPQRPTAPDRAPARPSLTTGGVADLGSEPLAASPAGLAIDAAPLTPLPRQPSLLARLMTLLLFVLLLITAIWQLLLVAHTPLIRLYPSLYPLWAEACLRLGCTVAPPADRQYLRIDDARLIKERDPTYYSLELTLANTAPYPMAWPHLAITLTDGLGRALVRKILSPGEWGAPRETPLPPRQRLALVLTLQTVESGIVGFEVTPFYP